MREFKKSLILIGLPSVGKTILAQTIIGDSHFCKEVGEVKNMNMLNYHFRSISDYRCETVIIDGTTTEVIKNITGILGSKITILSTPGQNQEVDCPQFIITSRTLTMGKLLKEVPRLHDYWLVVELKDNSFNHI